MKKQCKKIIAMTLILSLVVSVYSYAGVNGGTEDIVAPTAAYSESYEGEATNTTVERETTGGYNAIANQTYKSPLDPMGLVANVGAAPSGVFSTVINGPFDTKTVQNAPVVPITANAGATVSTGFISYDNVDGYTKGVTVGAPTAILVNATTRKVYYGKNQNATYLPAGLGNLMTAYIAVKYMNLDDVLQVHTSAVKGVDKDAAIAALNNGDGIILRDAIGAMFTKGCVDCANVIAENVAGSIDKFVELMNNTAKEIGCLNTTFKNPSGLDADGQMSSAYDIAIIMDKLTENNALIELMSKTEYKLPAVSRRGELILYSKNTMLSKDSQHYNADINCSRLGYTKKAEYTMASEFTYGKNKFIVVVLQAKGTHFSDTKKMYEYAKKAFDEGK